MIRYRPTPRYVTKSDVLFEANYQGRRDPQWVLPAGSEVVRPRNSDGWAVKSTALLIKKTGNQIDPIHRYYWVPTEVVHLVT